MGVCSKGQTDLTKCRFDYPRPIVQITGFKNGVIQLKRWDSRCNNYNKALLSCLRCNMDIKFVTNGADAKATIFYITDYVTKNELSVYQSVTVARDAMEKIEKNEYPRKNFPNCSDAENKSRKRVYTFLNMLDSHVERSGQWVATLLLGLPLEYSSHTFRKFSTLSFTNFVLANALEPDHDNDPKPPQDSLDDVLEETVDEGFTVDITSDTVILTNQRVDFQNRCSRPDLMNRFLDRRTGDLQNVVPSLHEAYPSYQHDLAQMSPFEYVKRVKKVPMEKETKQIVEECLDSNLSNDYLENMLKDVLLPNHCLFNPAHPQSATHLQVVSDATNPKVPHPVPVMLSYTFPSEESDPLKFYLMVMTLLTPWQKPEDILRDQNNTHITFKESYRIYRDHLHETDPQRLQWFDTMIENLRALSQGRDQQKKERIERERLRREQGLEKKDPSDPIPGYDYCAGEDDEGDKEPAPCGEEFLQSLPKDGPFTRIRTGYAFSEELECLSHIRSKSLQPTNLEDQVFCQDHRLFLSYSSFRTSYKRLKILFSPLKAILVLVRVTSKLRPTWRRRKI